MSYEINSERFVAPLLTERESEIVQLVSQGLPNRAVAGALGVQEGTIKLHLHKINRKLGVSNRTGLILNILAKRSLTS